MPYMVAALYPVRFLFTVSINSNKSELVGQVVQSLLSLQDNCHPLVKRSAIKVLHHLSDWVNSHQSCIGKHSLSLSRK